MTSSSDMPRDSDEIAIGSVLPPIPVGTIVDYTGSHTHGRYVVTEHAAPRDGIPDPEVNYPDGVAYTIWKEGVPQKFGNRMYCISQVRRGSLTVAREQQP